ncbi:transglycosylase SLT domain-containing protein [Loktanella sp. IMCC34160]|uniref:transglycosylase SLT domain-containing protein n=1 Tax=Loktanella sp. IMCC34160 TaxID=2510646 RepID=UPI001F5C5DF5|nr:transglycosylase SLT domain-containing protein [Loktanella sp. IMCC34160]
MEGAGRWFDDASGALDFAKAGLAQGRTSFDVGCFQINYRWHGMHFASLEDMFDPDLNALYAARFLNRLQSEGRSWSEAAGAYHSRTPEYAARYRETFDAHFSALETGGPVLASAQEAIEQQNPALTALRVNTYPLLQRTEGTLSLGSLVPLDPRG